jgi:hypothetical protein
MVSGEAVNVSLVIDFHRYTGEVPISAVQGEHPEWLLQDVMVRVPGKTVLTFMASHSSETFEVRSD